MPMELDIALIFIRTHSRSVLATRRRNGFVQMSPVNAGVVDGAVCVSSRAPLAKVHNIRRDPRVSLLVFTEEFYGSWVQVDGRAEIVDQPEALESLARAGSYDWDDVAAKYEALLRRLIDVRAKRG